jgi:hypothetical protein
VVGGGYPTSAPVAPINQLFHYPYQHPTIEGFHQYPPFAQGQPNPQQMTMVANVAAGCGGALASLHPPLPIEVHTGGLLRVPGANSNPFDATSPPTKELLRQLIGNKVLREAAAQHPQWTELQQNPPAAAAAAAAAAAGGASAAQMLLQMQTMSALTSSKSSANSTTTNSNTNATGTSGANRGSSAAASAESSQHRRPKRSRSHKPSTTSVTSDGGQDSDSADTHDFLLFCRVRGTKTNPNPCFALGWSLLHADRYHVMVVHLAGGMRLVCIHSTHSTHTCTLARMRPPLLFAS